MEKTKTIFCEECGTSVTCPAKGRTRFCRPCAKARKNTAAGKLRTAMEAGRKACSLCGQNPIRGANRWLCYECHSDPDRDHQGDGSLEKLGIHLTGRLKELKRGLNKQVKILTTSPRTVLKHPQAQIVSKRYMKKERTFSPGRFSCE